MNRCSFFLILALMLTASSSFSQVKIKVDVSADTVRVGDRVQLTYAVENGNGTFQIPDMKGLPVISGPNTSSSFMYQHGEKSSSQSWSFVLKPAMVGILAIPGTSYITATDTLKIEPLSIVVLGRHEDSITQHPSGIKTTREKKKF